MNLNPFIYKYKTYKDCPLSNSLSGILSGIQRVMLFFSIFLVFGGIFFEDKIIYELFITAFGFFIIYLIIRKYKTIWTDKLAEKEYKRNKL